MTKLKSKSLKRIVALALTLVLCLAITVPVLAAPVTGGTEASPIQIAITKLLEMPVGTTTPTADFIFEIKKIDFNGETTGTNYNEIPILGTAINTTTGTFTLSSLPASLSNTVGGLKTVYLQTGDIFAGVTWPRAGVYKYNITERANTYTIADPLKEDMTYSGGDYDMFVYVENGATKNFVTAVSSVVGTPATPGQSAGQKVPGTPGTPGDYANYSKMSFTNVYTKNPGPNPADTALVISKAVAGGQADQTKYFDYTLTLTKPATITTAVTYKVYVMEGATVVTAAANYGGTILTDAYGAYFEADSGTAESVSLKHGQHLAFGSLHIGAQYQVSEAAALKYTPSIALTVNGTASTVPGTENTALGTGPHYIGELANIAAYTNTYATVTPTGLDVNDLPFIMLLVVVAGALVTFVAVKYRKKARNNSN